MTSSFNKWAGAFLSALLLMFGLRTVIMESRPEGPPAKPGYQVADASQAPAAAATPAKAAQADPPIADLLKKADADSGQKLTKPCQSCHDFTKGGPNKVGPNLWSVVGRKMGGIDGFAYSDGMKAKGGTWNYDELYQFLKDPKAYINGTKMGFAGYPEPANRADVIAYLRTLSDNPAPLP